MLDTNNEIILSESDFSRKTEKLEKLLLDLKRGIQISTSKLQEQNIGNEESKCRLITNSDIEDCYIVENKEKKIVEIDMKKQKQFLITESNVIILTKSGPNFKVGITNCDNGEKYLVSNNLYALKVNDKVLQPYFLLYYLNSNAGKKLLKERSVVSKVPVLNCNDVYNLDIPVPPMDIQNQISEKMVSVINSIKAAKLMYNAGIKRLEDIDKILSSYENTGN